MLFEPILRKMFGSEVCRVRGSRDVRNSNSAIWCEFLHPQRGTGNVLNYPSPSSKCYCSSSRCVNHILVLLLMSTSRSLTIKTAPTVWMMRCFCVFAGNLRDLTWCTPQHRCVTQTPGSNANVRVSGDSCECLSPAAGACIHRVIYVDGNCK